MSGLKSGLVTLAFTGVCGVLAMVGCTADGGSTALDEPAAEPTEPSEPGAQLPASSGGGGGGGGTTTTDGGKAPAKDAGAKDSAPPDAGPPPPVVGTACSVIDEVRKKACGACGTQATLCLRSAGDSGAGTWSVYSQCDGELAGGCVPGTVVDAACGNCGTQKKTCTQYCAFTTTACAGQPVDSCVPGGVELSSAGCPTANQFRQRACTTSCVSKNFSATCEAAPTTVEVGPTPGSVTSTIAILSEKQTISLMSGACPDATFSKTVVSPYVYLKVHNPLPTSAVVAIYNSLAAGGQTFETALAAYEGATGPTAEEARKACASGAATYGDSSLTGSSDFASLDGPKAVTIAAGATVTVYVAAQNAFNPLKPTESTGKVKLNVQTISAP